MWIKGCWVEEEPPWLEPERTSLDVLEDILKELERTGAVLAVSEVPEPEGG
jgi:hypothetical protein